MTDPVRTHVLPTMGRDQQVRAAATVLRHARDLDDARNLLEHLFAEHDGMVPCLDCGTRITRIDGRGKRRTEPRCMPCANRAKLANHHAAQRAAVEGRQARETPPSLPHLSVDDATTVEAPQ